MTNSAVLALENGAVFRGRSIGADGHSVGEVVFNTAMTGYQEILSDPSYARQIVTLTYPHIGNTGVNAEDMESKRLHAAGLVIRDLPRLVSNWRSERPLDEYLREQGFVAISDIDTRRLTRILREQGAQNGCLWAGADAEPERALEAARAFPGIKGMDVAREVTTDEAYTWRGGGWSLDEGYRTDPRPQFRVAAYDFGIKHNILRMLTDRGCEVTVVPATTPAEDVLAERPDGIFLSNGPGDPEPCDYAVDAIKVFLRHRVPLFGICLGHQLLALAAGGATVKMKFGHHGANHPVKDLDTGLVLISSQNHGFAVREHDLPDDVRVTHRSLFDASVQGIECTDAPAFSFQGHPEASPGPHDLAPMFDRFVTTMREHGQQQALAGGPVEHA
ncbi:MAG: glutamine-hydrolyzing carbamoyl-phosphate synthase small subunit [Gammaproteobacteria bacterium]|nr:glutamine-hydrolyzing carbamoyl-phosphate synthase small subunit [Gammaproteobacteria bacterium]